VALGMSAHATTVCYHDSYACPSVWKSRQGTERETGDSEVMGVRSRKGENAGKKTGCCSVGGTEGGG